MHGWENERTESLGCQNGTCIESKVIPACDSFESLNLPELLRPGASPMEIGVNVATARGENDWVEIEKSL